MKCSIVIATKDKESYLKHTLDSIFSQQVPFEFEVIVVDDGSTDDTPALRDRTDIKYIRLENETFRNPAIARNVGYRAATGDIIIAQSDEVIHASPSAIRNLCTELQKGEFLIATVYNYCMKSRRIGELYSGTQRHRPLFFLGSLWRKDLYAVGGNDEEFTKPGYEDDWFADCLTKGLGLKPRFLDEVVAYHQDHFRPQGLSSRIAFSRDLYSKKLASGIFMSSGGPWTESD